MTDTTGILEAMHGIAPRGKTHQLQIPRLIKDLDEEELLATLNDTSASTASASVNLRKWVDEWIASGRDAKGKENPCSRNFNTCRLVAAEVNEYSRDHLTLAPVDDAVYARIDNFNPAVGRERALFLLTSLLLTPAMFQIARCPDCDTYFMLPPRKVVYPTGTPCSSCYRLRREQGSRTITASTRRGAEQELYTAVATRFASKIQAKGEGWWKYARLAESIVRHLNTTIGQQPNLKAIYFAPPRKGVTTTWLARARNRDAIATLVFTKERISRSPATTDYSV